MVICGSACNASMIGNFVSDEDSLSSTLSQDFLVPSNGSAYNVERVNAWLRIRRNDFTVNDVVHVVFDATPSIVQMPIDASEVSSERFDELVSERETRPVMLSKDVKAFKTRQFT